MRSLSASSGQRLKRLKDLSWLNASQIGKFANALSISWLDGREILFDQRSSTDTAYILISGVAQVTCRNRKGRRVVVTMLPPGVIPSFTPPVLGINSNLRCEAVTSCQIGTIDWDPFVHICLGARSADFKRLARGCLGRWDAVQLRCLNFMSCTLAERLALILLELSDDFGVPHAMGVRLTIEARQKDLAQLLSASRPSISTAWRRSLNPQRFDS